MSDTEQNQEIPEEKRPDPNLTGSGASSAGAGQLTPEEPAAEEPQAEPSAEKKQVSPLSLFPPVSRWKKWGADSIKVGLALAVLILGFAIWFQPPLVSASKPYVTYTFQGKAFTDAMLYRPLAIPTRFYVKLPHELARRYLWFSIDLRREVVALAQEPERRFFNAHAVRRGDPLGLDLEFTKIDGLEWHINFYPESIVFSNAILKIQLDTKKPEGRP